MSAAAAAADAFRAHVTPPQCKNNIKKYIEHVFFYTRPDDDDDDDSDFESGVFLFIVFGYRGVKWIFIVVCRRKVGIPKFISQLGFR